MDKIVHRRYSPWQIVLNAGLPVIISSVLLGVIKEESFDSEAHFWAALIGIGLAVFLPAYLLCYVLGRLLFGDNARRPDAEASTVNRDNEGA